MGDGQIGKRSGLGQPPDVGPEVNLWQALGLTFLTLRRFPPSSGVSEVLAPVASLSLSFFFFFFLLFRAAPAAYRSLQARGRDGSHPSPSCIPQVPGCQHRDCRGGLGATESPLCGRLHSIHRLTSVECCRSHASLSPETLRGSVSPVLGVLHTEE